MRITHGSIAQWEISGGIWFIKQWKNLNQLGENMETIKLNLHVPATVYPTLEVSLDQWKKAKKSVEEGIAYTLVGAYGGTNCRGGYIPAGLHSVTLKALEQEGCWLGEMEMWGQIRISLSCEVNDACVSP